MPMDHIYRLRANIRIAKECVENENKEIRYQIWESLMNALLGRAKEIAKEYLDKRIQVIQYVDAKERETIQECLSVGFGVFRSSLVMHRDLSGEIPEYPLPEGLEIKQHLLETDEEIRQYNQLDGECNKGNAWSFHLMQWIRYSPGWKLIGAFAGQEFIGGVMLLEESSHCGATENVFVAPQWQGKGVAKAFLSNSWKHLKSTGKTKAKLVVFGDNIPAISLYQSIGYEFESVDLELAYDVNS